MTQFDPAVFEEFILEEKVAGFFEKAIQLKSGRRSHWYVNWRSVTNDVFLLDRLCDFILDFVESQKLAVDCFYGVPEGATKTGLLSQYKWAKRQSNFSKGSHVLAMGRAKAKLHGDPKDRYFVGQPKGKTVVVEDVTTTGGSLIETMDQLREAGVNVVAVLGLTNRGEKPVDASEGMSVADRIAKRFGKDLPYYALSHAHSLLPKLAARLNPSAEVLAALEAEYAEYGTSPLKLR
ncbi:MAG: hypothetical protein H6617_11280 [Bdellovibrionaceae bacterium]|nr:hypothetical protein [Bdellovibrionales bacterium]MCB9255255.1 hypothetical protein [Pseudobdellovibrionaceae bacterium]